ncbi:MAG TPA: glycoside hydrolase family 2 [Candidatus Hydrogenedentes bacterium]|nr:glycoside hydrolase family 2 [Candidatus Hydrogenedentota bacterium]HPG69325.1 glycoside hydrolase family 2 [Candidatus Hydrogenedentota bacterium]
MSRITLDGAWTLCHFPEGDHAIATPTDLDAAALDAIEARVPGNVELDLVHAGALPDPFFGANIHLLRPYEFHEWWYSREFDGPAEGAEEDWDIVFSGLDTLATVWLNDSEVGRADNMLIEHRFDVSHALHFGARNRVTVRLQSPIQFARQQHYEPGMAGAEHREEALFIRKAPHMFGWDIFPRAVSAGIWRPAWLEAQPKNAIEQLYYWTAGVDAGGATLGVRFQFRTDARELDGFSLRFHGACDGHTFDFEWPVEFVAGGCHIHVPDARLWWPRGYGKPDLYTITAQLCRDGDVLAERTDRVGLRTLVVDRTDTAGPQWMPGPKGNGRYSVPPEPDHHFVFYVNGCPIMVKGANWVPLDAFHGRDAERVDDAVALFDDLGCNMIRCWGGGVYEDHRFFDLCDEKGMLVWQDFAFACGRYPHTDAFLDKVRVEAQSVVEKLRNHACLALWCGDNEIDASYEWGGGLSPERNRINREVLPRVVHRCDPYRHYVPSSPYMPPGTGNGTPEQHLWGPRGYYKGPYYTHHNAHFIGEIGYHGCPNVSSIRRFISQDALWPWQDNREWHIHDSYHWRHDRIDRDRIGLMANQVREVFGTVPDDLDTFALASQIVQAEAKKFFIESTRLRKWRTSGILWWNVIDGWPQFSDAIVDYFFGKKLAYYYIHRAQRPVSIIIGESGSEKYRPVVVCNDTREAVRGTYRIADADTGDAVAEGAFDVPANENWQVTRLRCFQSDQGLYTIEWTIGERRFGSHYLAGTPPFALDRYRRWLDIIAALAEPFDAAIVAK